MSALASSLLAFFRYYSCPGSLHGILQFHGEANAEQLSSEFRPLPLKQDTPWAELVVLDPTQGAEDPINLAPPLSPATQLLLVYELERAADRLQQALEGSISPGEAACSHTNIMNQADVVFEASPHLKNTLPSMALESMAAFLLQGDPSKGVGSVEVAFIERIVPRQGWSAAFLHRSDTTSELHARMCEVSEGSGSCQPRREGVVVLCPCHFICAIELQREGSRYKLLDKDLERFRRMRSILSKLHTHRRALGDLTSPPQFGPKQGGRRRGRRGLKKAEDKSM